MEFYYLLKMSVSLQRDIVTIVENKCTIFAWLQFRKRDLWTLLLDLCANDFSVSFGKVHGDCANKYGTTTVPDACLVSKPAFSTSGCFHWPLVPDLAQVRWNLLGNVTSFLNRCLRRKSMADKQRWCTIIWTLIHYFLLFIKRDYSSKESIRSWIFWNFIFH